MRKWIIALSLVGTLGLCAGLHHIVVLTVRGTAFSNAFAGTCQWCHGQTYQGFGVGTAQRSEVISRRH